LSLVEPECFFKVSSLLGQFIIHFVELLKQVLVFADLLLKLGVFGVFLRAQSLQF
jgi:hypothetical protein